MFSTTLCEVVADTLEAHRIELQLPPRGEPKPGSAFLLRGCVVGPGPMTAELRVSVHQHSFRTWPVEVTEHREQHCYDLSAVVNLLGTPESITLSLELVGENGWHLPIATLKLRRSRQPSTNNGIQGIFVVSLGRSGSTMLMSALAAHPDLVAYERHPYETRIAQQYARLAKTLFEPADFTDPELEAFSQTHCIRSNAYLRPDGDSIILMDSILSTANLDHCTNQVARFYRGYAAQRNKTATKFVEKCLPDPQWIRLLQDLFPGAKIVVLVRDFRDVYKSVLAFNKRRGFPAFGREKVDTDLEYIDRLAASAEALIEVSATPGAVLVRYEDVIATPAITLQETLERLDIRAPLSAIQPMLASLSKETPERSKHQTARSKQASVARWQSESSPAELAKYSERLLRPLSFFGYATDHT